MQVAFCHNLTLHLCLLLPSHFKKRSPPLCIRVPSFSGVASQ
ncbi:hypothetical protein T4C_7907 [Trichinella pseudospiralis]|uniref:Uncharacterized protein n=1 Tax=Trichinella pseudospiralis TaxID=6337 RepID=A0A0V1GQ31_TRIPS|nr:hypothetical protein T4C_7907 [Trichinella pseudospiralis]